MSSFDYEKNLLEKIDFNQYKPLSEIIYLGLKELILDGSFPLGERINEHRMAEILSISRTPIRKAIKKLTHEGLTQCINKYGTVVSYVSPEKIDEIYKIRLSLELILYQEILQKISPKEIDDLLLSCQQMIDFELVDDIEQLLCQLNDFNKKTSQIANMSTLTALLEELNTYFKNFRNFSFMSKKRRQIAVKEHMMIVRCIEAGDLVILTQVVTKHIKNAKCAAMDTFINNEKSFSLTLKQLNCPDNDCPLCMHKK